MSLQTLFRLHDFKDKTILVRIDSDVDIEHGKILDDTRLKSSLQTIKYIVKNHGRVILLGHLGRPDGKEDPQYTLAPIAHWFATKFSGETVVAKFGNFLGWQITKSLALLENLRFHPGEEENDPEMAEQLAKIGDYYVNESFAVSHRNHASITGITKYLPSYAGFHLVEEVEELSKVLNSPKRPLVVLIGGAKIETKLPMVEEMHRVADYVLVGGKIADETKELIKVQHEKIQGHKSIVLVADNTTEGTDITDQDAENFIQIISLGKTIVWNGPMGKVGTPKTEESSLKIAQAIIDSGAYSVIGGGDSLTLLDEHDLLDKFSFVSTGGGAMLEFLSGKELPGIKALETT